MSNNVFEYDAKCNTAKRTTGANARVIGAAKMKMMEKIE